MPLADSTLSPAARSVWAKTNRETGQILPLFQHMLDSAEVAGWLWDHWLPRAITDSLTKAAGNEAGRRLFRFLAGAHDIGKASPAFAQQIAYVPGLAGVLDDMTHHGLVCPPRLTGGRPLPHCLIGQAVLTRWLMDQYGASPLVAAKYGYVVGAHHGVPPSAAELQQCRHDPSVGLTDPAWSAARAELLDRIANVTEADLHLSDWAERPLSVTAQVQLAGAVVIADWLASDEARFPYGVARDELDPERLSDWDLPKPWQPQVPSSADSLMTARFPGLGDLRPVQRAAAEVARSVSEPPLLVIEAGTGEGKTEAALLAAEILAAKFGHGGVAFALPTQATTDSIFPRLLDWLHHQDSTARTSVFLAHGKSGLNDEFRDLARSGRFRGIGDDSHGVAGPVVTSWLQGRRKGVFANVVAATIDQVLFAALKSRHLPMRQLALAGKVVVIDECHAADRYMQVYLEAALAWFGALGTPVVLLSATLPPETRQALCTAYYRGRMADDEGELELPTGDEYPRLTSIGHEAHTTYVDDVGHVARELRVASVPEEAWLEEVVTAVRAGACVAVVRNTVSRAQLAYEDLVAELPSDAVVLVHSQFVAPHRVKKETTVRDRLGPPGRSERPRGMVVVGTQVIEQSLDIDVDLMVSDIAPIDLVLQRAGRLHRHVRGADEQNRPAEYRRPRLLLTGMRWHGEETPEFDPGCVAVYGESSLLRSAAVLRSHIAGLTLVTPRDVSCLVRDGYAAEIDVPEGWRARLADADTDERDRVGRRVAAAKAYCLESPAEVSNLAPWARGRSDEPDGARQTGSAQVRDSGDSVEVVVVIRSEGEVRPVPGCGFDKNVVIPTELGPPDPDLARRLSGCTLRLPRALCHPGRIDRTIDDLERAAVGFDGWQQSAWLAGELPLVLDAGLSGRIGDITLRYSLESGLHHAGSGEGE